MCLILLWLACSTPPTAPPPPAEPRAAPASPERSKAPRRRQAAPSPESEPEQGLWNEKQQAGTAAEIAQLEALGYLGGETAGAGLAGVTVSDTSRIQPGLNLWTSGHAPEAYLMAADGTVLHTWRRAFSEAYPGRTHDPSKHGTQFWRRAHLLPDGHLLVIFEGQGLVHLDRHSRVVWAWEGLAHHDLEVLDDGRILVLSRQAHVVPRIHPTRPVLEDFVSIVSSEGEELSRVSLLEAVENSEFAHLWTDRKSHGDLFHTNALELLRGPGDHPAFQEGRILTSFRAFHAVGLLDLDSKRLEWATKGDFARQHDPHLLSDGTVMLFDNLGRRGASSVITLDPTSDEIAWSWGRGADQRLYTRFCGAATRQPNGNTLITESGNGRALEVTASGDIVWEFHNPHRAGSEQQFVAIIPEVVRVPTSAAPWLPVRDTP